MTSPKNSTDDIVLSSDQEITLEGLGPEGWQLDIVLTAPDVFARAALDAAVIAIAPVPPPFEKIRKAVLDAIENDNIVVPSHRPRCLDLVQRYYDTMPLQASSSDDEDDDEQAAGDPLTAFDHREAETLINNVLLIDQPTRAMQSAVSYYISVRGLVCAAFCVKSATDVNTDKPVPFKLERQGHRITDASLNRLHQRLGDSAFTALQMRATALCFLSRDQAKN